MKRGLAIEAVQPGSIAEELGIRAGDRLLSINEYPLADILDYYYLAGEENISVGLLRADGEQWLLDVEKDSGEDLGIQVEGIGTARPCANKCMFCFVDQMPPGLRDSLSVKDDDYRHSFLLGNYITLTNITARQLERIAGLQLSPLYVSVHTTNPLLRQKMLNNRRAGEIMEQLHFLTERGIRLHTQVVLCPGLNDGRELEKTIDDLANLWPGVKSLAVVPVGLTIHREGLPPVKGVSADAALAVIDLVEAKQQQYLKDLGSRFVFAADEFYLRCRRAVPDSEAYEDFPQLENGVGLVRVFSDEWERLLAGQLVCEDYERSYYIGTGQAAAPLMRQAVLALARKFPELNIKVVNLDNYFFGRQVTVSGLITGQDVVRNINQKLTVLDRQEGVLLLPAVMCKKDSRLFLDDMTVDQAAAELEIKIEIVDTEAEALLNALGVHQA